MRKVLLFPIISTIFAIELVVLDKTKKIRITRDYHTVLPIIPGLRVRTDTVLTRLCLYLRWRKQETFSISSAHAVLAKAYSFP